MKYIIVLIAVLCCECSGLIYITCSMAPGSAPSNNLSQGSMKFFCKRPDGKFVRLFRTYGLYCNSAILHKNSHR